VRLILRGILWTVLVVAAVGAAALWWYVYRPLPQTDGEAQLPGLTQQATIERDAWGVPHITAASLRDAAEAQGYATAQDRLWQMDLLRRVARGELSEIVGPAGLPIDKAFRTLRLGAAADRDAALIEPELRPVMDAYARGVNEFIAQHEGRLPVEFSLLHYKPRPWRPSDSLAIAAYMYQTLTSTWQSELNRARVTTLVGANRAKELYSQDSRLDHYVVGGPPEKDGPKNSNPGDGDDDEVQPETVLKASVSSPAILPDFPDLTSALWPAIAGEIAGTRREIRRGLGSNNWVVSGSHTASGKPILANDTHLELTVPSIWYEVHLTAPGWNVKGFTLPGAPLVVIGHNDHIAWGFTNNGADVQDLYIETFNSEQPDEYRVNGTWEKAVIDDEVIHVRNQPDQHLRLVVTRHGPVVHREGGKAYALRWTATEPGALANSYMMLGVAANWTEFRDVLKKAWGPAQNIVYADAQGNIGYIMAARVPVRKKGRGEVPVPGDTDDYEWNGYIPFDQLPQTLNPDSGLIVTANARVVGPAYRPYLTDKWEEPYRTARIWDLLYEKHDLHAEDMLKVETDTFSYPDYFLAQQLATAAQVVHPGDAPLPQLISSAKDWNGMADADSPLVPFLEGCRRAALRLILEPYLGKDTALYDWRSMAFLQRVLTERPPKWLPPAYKSYDDLLMAAAAQSVAYLEAETASRNPADWPWKRFNPLDMMHPLGRSGVLRRVFSRTAIAQSGTAFSVRAATRDHGPSMRFVADAGDWDNSILLITTGESGQIGSAHFMDQLPYWLNGKPIVEPFSAAAEAKLLKHTLSLKP
jgi:penicillin amidase